MVGGASHTYGSVAATDTDGSDGKTHHHNLRSSLKTLKDASSRVAFLESTRTHHHPTADVECGSPTLLSNQHIITYQRLNSETSVIVAEDKDSLLSHTNLRKIALDFSLWINVFILVTKAVAYFETRSLSILAALVDSILDVVSIISGGRPCGSGSRTRKQVGPRRRLADKKKIKSLKKIFTRYSALLLITAFVAL